ncbi:MAG TPA: Maf family protein [Patescibacteria group bacterium]|nr:Maf family protein [Patescibacteria group bacterium]
MKVILASASPRRRELLNQIGCVHEVRVSGVDEDNHKEVSPELMAVAHAREKSLAVARECSDDCLVIGADTLVVLAGKVFGKPRDAMDAVRMLQQLNGQKHLVISGVAVVYQGQIWSDYAVTTVTMRALSGAEIKQYVASGEPLDKAGAYGIQGKGALLVERIEGCYFNVVGLPLTLLERLTAAAGVRLL